MRKLRKFLTVINAVHPQTGDVLMYGGPVVFAFSHEDAERICRETHGCATVVGEYMFTMNDERTKLVNEVEDN